MASIATASTTPFKLPPESVVFGKSESMKAISAKLERVAAANLPVLIHGESGTGKEIIARLIHLRSPLQAGPFVRVSCSGIPGTSLETELFSQERSLSAAAIEIARRGTLFLDEIAELELGLQRKLLQCLQDAQFLRIGDQPDTKLDARIICSTKKNLQNEVELGNFRQDLFYRINVLQIEMPPLRDRKDDIPILVDYLLELNNERYNAQARPPSSQVLRILQDYRWPGNIRELENLMKRYVILGTEEAITTELLSTDQSQFTPEIPLDGSVSLKKVTRQAVHELERQVILRSLQANNWNRKRVARALGISYRALLYKIRDAGLVSSRGSRRAAAAGADSDRAA